MALFPYLLPWVLVLLAVALAVAAKLLPLKSILGVALVAALGLLMIATGIYSNLLTAEQNGLIDKEKAKLAKVEEWKYQHLDQLSLLIARLPFPEDEQVALYKKLLDHGWLQQSSGLQQTLDAIQALETALVGHEPADRAIYLYKGIPESVNKDILQLSLTRLGLKILPPRADEPFLQQGNLLYFGKFVAPKDVRLTALTLMSAGIPLGEIKRFKQDTRGNVRAMKLEYSGYLSRRPPLSVKDVVTAEKF